MNDAALHNELKTALAFYADCGVDVAVLDDVIDRTVMEEMPSFAPSMAQAPAQNAGLHDSAAQILAQNTQPAFLGKSDAYDEALRVAKAASTIDELRQAIAEFDGVAVKKTASNLVFADGNPDADVMVIGDAPGADEDRVGKPFVGAHGQLLDKILACIDLDRAAETPETQAYISTILNWRPPGNRSPNPAEIEVSLPFIERHIQLANPKILILCGGTTAKALLGRSEGISRLRKTWHDYTPVTEGVGNTVIPAIVTYQPSSLLKTPVQKKSVWADMLSVAEKRQVIQKSE